MSGLDLYLTQRTLALMFVYAAVAGFSLGGVYDALRVLRVVCGDDLNRGQGSTRPLYLKIFLFAEDVLFMILASVTLILLCYYTNDGQLRAPAYVGMACGFFVYLHTLGRLTKRFAKPAVRRLTHLLILVLSPLWRPARWVGRKAWRVMSRLRGNMRERRAARQMQKEQDQKEDGNTAPDTAATPNGLPDSSINHGNRGRIVFEHKGTKKKGDPHGRPL